jgi:endonuclease/exonuclease/phosphatase family metal-dependent hydrolase
MEQLQSDTQNIILIGDKNSEVDEEVHQVLRRSAALGLCNSMEAVGGGLQGTGRTIGPDAGDAIDHIYVSDALRSGLRWAEVVTRPGFHAADVGAVRRGEVWVHSDHLPVSCELVVEAGGAGGAAAAAAAGARL